MKKFTQIQLLLAGVILFGLYSCAPKYTANFQPSSNFYEPETAHPKISEEVKVENEIKEVHEMKDAVLVAKIEESTPMTDQAIVSTEKVLPPAKETPIAKLVEKHKERIDKIENSNLDRKERKEELKRERKVAKKEIKKELKKEIKELKHSNASDNEVLMIILAILLPPLAVGLTYGIVDKFWISLLLTLLFFIPGMIYSIIVVHDYYH